METKRKLKIRKLCFYMLLLSITIITTLRRILIENHRSPMAPERRNMVYILQWGDLFEGNGQHFFRKHRCPVNNCYYTENRSLLSSLTDYNAVLFRSQEIYLPYIYSDLPDVRSPRQKYIFVSMESPAYYPMIDKKYDSFFNWTSTYRLSSELYMGYIIIKNIKGEIIGPRCDIHWLKPEEMKPINDTLKVELRFKNVAAAWFVSNCKTPSKREMYVKEITSELAKYNMTLDTFGNCGPDPNLCPMDIDAYCRYMVKKRYFFYLAFENSFDEDYVTEKILIALKNNAVPIVFGGANYSRFLPPGAYLNARMLGVKTLVKLMVIAMNDNNTYYDYFKWTNHYIFEHAERSPDTNYHCKLCKKLNENVKQIPKVYDKFKEWWGGE